MLRHLRPAFLMLLVLTILTGILYPLAVTGVAQALFPWRAGGSLLERDGKVVGSALVGQPFQGRRYLWGRPSATSPACNAAASTGSNLGPTSPALAEAVTARLAALRDPDHVGPVPVDLVTTSASGLDPHVSPAAARWQALRIAHARGISVARVLAVIDAHVEGRTLGILGEPRVNVLRVNLALDELP